MAFRNRRWGASRYHNGPGDHAPHISFVHRLGLIHIELKKQIQSGEERSLLLTSEEFFDISLASKVIRQAGGAIANYSGRSENSQPPKSFNRFELIVVKKKDHKAEHMYERKFNETLRVCVRNRRGDGRKPIDTDFVVEVRRFNGLDRPTDNGIMMAWHNFEGTFVHHRKARRDRIREMKQLISSAPAANSSSKETDLPMRKVVDKESSSETCVICLDTFTKEEQITGLPNCTHTFHGNCIRAWLQGSDHCPICRTKVQNIL
jgi:Ring finger domain